MISPFRSDMVIRRGIFVHQARQTMQFLNELPSIRAPNDSTEILLRSWGRSAGVQRLSDSRTPAAHSWIEAIMTKMVLCFRRDFVCPCVCENITMKNAKFLLLLMISGIEEPTWPWPQCHGIHWRCGLFLRLVWVANGEPTHVRPSYFALQDPWYLSLWRHLDKLCRLTYLRD